MNNLQRLACVPAFSLEQNRPDWRFQIDLCGRRWGKDVNVDESPSPPVLPDVPGPGPGPIIVSVSDAIEQPVIYQNFQGFQLGCKVFISDLIGDFFPPLTPHSSFSPPLPPSLSSDQGVFLPYVLITLSGRVSTRVVLTASSLALAPFPPISPNYCVKLELLPLVRTRGGHRETDPGRTLRRGGGGASWHAATGCPLCFQTEAPVL